MVLYKKIRKWEVMMGLKAVGHSGLVWGYEKWCLFSVPLWIGLGLREFASLIIQIFFLDYEILKIRLGFFRIPLRTALVSSNLAKQIKSQRWLVTSLRLTFKVHRPKNLRYCADLQKLSAVGRRLWLNCTSGAVVEYCLNVLQLCTVQTLLKDTILYVLL
jgi:hypothetical protein